MFTNPAPLAETVDSLRQGQHSLSLFIEQTCLRINRVEPHIEALLAEPGRKKRLTQEGHALSDRYPMPADRPPLYGCLVGVKDIFHVDGYTTYAGTAVPPELFAGHEAASVALLREAGALILGKTVTTEFAYFEPGPTRNPHDLLHTPGGSSSGSAAAVSAGICTLALGTQTIGSVIRPAAFCGIIGFKPTYDRIPSAGLVYFSRTVDHVGLFTQDIDGMMLASSVLCDSWQEIEQPKRLPVLGVPDGPFMEQTELEALGAFEYQIEGLRERGVEIRRVPTLDDIIELNQLHRRMAFAEFAQEHVEIYPKHADLYRPRTREIIEIGRRVSETELNDGRANCAVLRQRLESQMTDVGIDLWICPPAPGPAPQGIEATGDPNMNLPWTHAGMPAITLPSGRSEMGLPLGLQLIGRFGQDEMLLAYAKQLDELLGDPLSE
jgi:Asp-tRNA(Asn)/Glu-tRNA(Gln) amidotransferase A subunit family amidase